MLLAKQFDLRTLKMYAHTLSAFKGELPPKIEDRE